MRQKKALIIRHVPYEGVAGYREPIEAAGYHIDRVDVTDPDFSSLDLRKHDLLIMMGGPMGVYEQDQYPWIACQLRRLALRLEADRPTLGVCFGAQMIAAAIAYVARAIVNGAWNARWRRCQPGRNLSRAALCSGGLFGLEAPVSGHCPRHRSSLKQQRRSLDLLLERRHEARRIPAIDHPVIATD